MIYSGENGSAIAADQSNIDSAVEVTVKGSGTLEGLGLTYPPGASNEHDGWAVREVQLNGVAIPVLSGPVPFLAIGSAWGSGKSAIFKLPSPVAVPSGARLSLSIRSLGGGDILAKQLSMVAVVK